MKNFRWLAVIACIGLIGGSLMADDQNGKGGGGKGGGGGENHSSGGGSHSSGGGESHSGGHSSGGGGSSSGGGSHSGGYSGGSTQSGGGGQSGGGQSGGGSGQGAGGKGGGNKGGGGGGGGSSSGGSSSGGGSAGNKGGGGSGGSSSGGGSNSGGSSNGGSSSGGSSNGGYSSGDRGGSGTGAGSWGGSSQSSGGSSTYRGGGSGYDQSGGRGNRDQSLLSKKSSRSGSVSYGTVFNVGQKSHLDRGVTISRPSSIFFRGGGSLAGQVRREDNPRLVRNNFRVGYYHYDPRWCDDFFFYPFYTFDPFGVNCVVSPWYYYPFLPGYVTTNRVTIITLPVTTWTYSGDPYRWNRPQYGYANSHFNDLDYAIEDLTDAFMNADKRAANRLVPVHSNVNIFLDGQYSYSLNADDFYDMFMDATQESHTISYQIVDVRRSRDTAYVTARHEFEDPWGGRRVVWHQITLGYERNNVVIKEFGTSDSR